MTEAKLLLSIRYAFRILAKNEIPNSISKFTSFCLYFPPNPYSALTHTHTEEIEFFPS